MIKMQFLKKEASVIVYVQINNYAHKTSKMENVLKWDHWQKIGILYTLTIVFPFVRWYNAFDVGLN